MIISSINSPRSFETSEATPPFCIFCIEGVVFNKELPFPSFLLPSSLPRYSGAFLIFPSFSASFALLSLSLLFGPACANLDPRLSMCAPILFLCFSRSLPYLISSLPEFIHSHKSRRCFFCKFWKISDTVRPKQALSNGSYSENWSNRSLHIIEQRGLVHNRGR